MPRQNLILQNDFPYGITARSNNREWFELPLDVCWKIFEDQIAETHERYGLQTHCFVLMSNHFHWLASTPQSNLGVAMRYFMTETSRHIARASGRINKIYGARYKWTVIANSAYYANTVRYFYQNPLRANICAEVDLYPWSTRSINSNIALEQHPFFEEWIPSDASELTSWLNQIPPGPYQAIMRKALRRSEFKFPPHPTNKRQIEDTSFLP